MATVDLAFAFQGPQSVQEQEFHARPAPTQPVQRMLIRREDAFVLRIPGHEVSGLVDEQPALVIPYTNCGKCSACRQGRFSCCRHNQTLGVQRDGALTDFYFFGYSIGGETRHPAEAWQWLSFLSRQRVSLDSPDNPTLIPARRSVAVQTNGYWSSLDAETTAAVKAILARQRASVPLSPVYPPDDSTDIISNLLFGACRAVISEHKPVEQALGEAQAEWERQQITDK